MPYYVYKISPSVTPLVKNLDAVEEFSSYPEAKKLVRELRSKVDAEVQVKIIFAENKLQAEELLQEKRDKPILQEWEK
ncbi:MAG: hypothetical protein KDJ38_05565 [Gammaproteobacteria bacterium]|nr:hypothetical protein [Gammaproteobacteria bacterium]